MQTYNDIIEIYSASTLLNNFDSEFLSYQSWKHCPNNMDWMLYCYPSDFAEIEPSIFSLYHASYYTYIVYIIRVLSLSCTMCARRSLLLKYILLQLHPYTLLSFLCQCLRWISYVIVNNLKLYMITENV